MMVLMQLGPNPHVPDPEHVRSTPNAGSNVPQFAITTLDTRLLASTGSLLKKQQQFVSIQYYLTCVTLTTPGGHQTSSNFCLW
eukprot:107559-Rhodomonas_salina.1